MSAIPQMYTDQFDQQPAVGDVDLSIMKSGVLTGVLASSVTGSKIAGTRVKLDASNTKPGTVAFVVAADNEAAYGVIKRTAQKTSFVAGDLIEVAYQGGPAMFLAAGATIAPGVVVGMASGFLVASDGTHTAMGTLLDYATDSTMVRVVIGHVTC